jgi:hypothetical protein
VWNSDGAAALVLVSGKKAQELGLHVLARINGFADAAQVSCSAFFFYLSSGLSTSAENYVGPGGL